MPAEISEALELARTARRNFPRDQVAPNELWSACYRDLHRSDESFDLTQHYRHAMTEAGMLIEARTGRPFAVCPDCGWTPDA